MQCHFEAAVTRTHPTLPSSASSLQQQQKHQQQQHVATAKKSSTPHLSGSNCCTCASGQGLSAAAGAAAEDNIDRWCYKCVGRTRAAAAANKEGDTYLSTRTLMYCFVCPTVCSLRSECEENQT